ncbi:MAG: hypothetical protein ACTHOO_09625 [Alcanivorax sp.]
MIDPDLRLQKPLEEYVETFDKLIPRAISLFEPLLDDTYIFEDPYHRAYGYKGLSNILNARYGLCKSSRYRVHDFMWGRRENTAYMFWEYTFERMTKKKAEVSAFTGMSELMFTKGGKILSHTDFWGTHDTFSVKLYRDLKL